MIDALRWHRAIAGAGLTLLSFEVMHDGTQAEFAVAGARGNVHVELWGSPPFRFAARITDDVAAGPRFVRDACLHRVLKAVCSRAREVWSPSEPALDKVHNQE